jgi:uroporphyrinogen decarboxylase
MSLNDRENYLRNALFEGCEWIPMIFHINAACWNNYPHEALHSLMASHPFLFPEFEKPEQKIVPQYSYGQSADEPYTDPWGCVWETVEDGITGVVTRHPLENWKDFENYQIPDPNVEMGRGPIDWEEEAACIRRAKSEGNLTTGGLRHGHTFLTLSDIRGYENLLVDMATEEPRLEELIRLVEGFNMEIVKRYVDLGVDVMVYPEDLGMQVGPMLSPKHLRKYIKPSYQRLIAPAREAGCLIHMHSDGDIRMLLDDLIEGGVQIINLQDLVNGIDWIEEHLAGKICIDLDIDRQQITHHGTPAEIDALIREEVQRLGSPRGGLMMVFGLYPGVPLENVKALMDAMEKYRCFHCVPARNRKPENE